MKKKILMGIIGALLTVCLAGGVTLLSRGSEVQSAEAAGNGMVFAIEDEAVALSDQEVFRKELPDEGIQIPGYANLMFEKDQTEQNMLLYNPEGNQCYFQYHIYLNGESIYDSNLIEPGTALQKIELLAELSAGDYEVEIHVDTYSLDSFEEMNGAVVYADLTVL